MKSYQFRVYPNAEQQDLMNKHFGCVRHVFNWALGVKDKHYQETQKNLSRSELQALLVQSKKEDKVWLKEVNSQSLLSSLLHLDSAYTNFFKGRAKFPKFKRKYVSTPSFQCPQHVSVDFESGLLYLPKFKTGIKTTFHRPFKGKIKTVTLKRKPSGKFYVSILVDDTKEAVPSAPIVLEQTLGIDLGLTHGRNFEEWLQQSAHLIGSFHPGEMRQMAAALRNEIADQFHGLCQAAAGYEQILFFGAQMAAPSVAQFYQIPHRYIAYCPLMYPSRYHAPPSFAQYHPPAWLNPMLWRLHRQMFNWMALPVVNPCRQELGLPPVQDIWMQCVYNPETPTLLAASPVLAPLPADVKDPCQTGFLALASQGELPVELQTFIQAGSPPLYIGLGSMVDGNPQALTQLLIQAIQKSGLRALIAKGWAGLTAEQLPDNIRLIEAVPHDVLFPLIAGVAHHGGAGTTATAALAGVPQIATPILLDQFYWGQRVNTLGVGPKPIPRNHLTVENLSTSFKQLALNENYRQQAQHLALQLQQENGVELTVKALGLTIL